MAEMTKSKGGYVGWSRYGELLWAFDVTAPSFTARLRLTAYEMAVFYNVRSESWVDPAAVAGSDFASDLCVHWDLGSSPPPGLWVKWGEPFYFGVRIPSEVALDLLDTIEEVFEAEI
jgi:hypothetical protein